MDGLYQSLAGRGLAYGPLFRGVSAGWRDGDRLYGEVELPEGADTAGFVIHPALLDAALHVLALGQRRGQESQESEGAALPFAWSQVTAHATAARSVRVTVSATPSGFALEMTDPAGGPVFSVGSLALRSVAPGGLSAAPRGTGDDLFAVDWKPLPLPCRAAAALRRGASACGCGGRGRYAVGDRSCRRRGPDHRYGGTYRVGSAARRRAARGCRGGRAGGGRVRDVVHRVLAVLQGFLAEPGWRDSRLVVATANAVAVRPGEGADPVASAVWGLVRSAQTENPGRFFLADTDADADPAVFAAGLCGATAAAAEAGEWQIAVRGEQVLVPRLVRVADGEAPGPRLWDAAAGGVSGPRLWDVADGEVSGPRLWDVADGRGLRAPVVGCGGHGAGHRWYGCAGRSGGPACRDRVRHPQCGAGVAAGRGGAGCRGTGG